MSEEFASFAGSSLVLTECKHQLPLFQPHGRREVVAEFDGGQITSDAGGLVLREVEQRFGIVRQFVGAFTDYRDAEKIEFSVESCCCSG